MVAESREEKELFNELQSHLKYALGMYSCMLQQKKNNKKETHSNSSITTYIVTTYIL